MTTSLNRIFTRNGTDTYGPRAVNPTYRVRSPKYGADYHVTRHRWMAPAASWGWKATPIGHLEASPFFADDLTQLAHKLGYTWEEIEGATI